MNGRDHLKGLGEFIRTQRELANLSLRQLADLAKVSNPYLSQVERGLYKPSAEVLKQIAKALHLSAETFYHQAGLLDEDVRPVHAFNPLVQIETHADNEVAEETRV